MKKHEEKKEMPKKPPFEKKDEMRGYGSKMHHGHGRKPNPR